MFCKKCGTEFVQNARFCTKCGAPAPTVLPASQGVTQEKKQQTAPKKKRNLLAAGIIGFLVLAAAATIVFLAVQSQNAEDEPKRTEKKQDEVVFDAEEKQNTEETETEDVQATENVVIATEETEVTTETETTEMEEVVRILGDDSVEPEAIHKYQIVMSDVTWSEAYLKSMEVSGGYLVHINSQEEMDAILKQIAEEGKENGIFWIGGMRGTTGEEYHWLDTQMNMVGEALNDKAYWLEGEPSLYDASLELEECYMNMFYVKASDKWIWNDTILDLVSVAPGYSGKIGYIIEIEE